MWLGLTIRKFNVKIKYKYTPIIDFIFAKPEKASRKICAYIFMSNLTRLVCFAFVAGTKTEQAALGVFVQVVPAGGQHHQLRPGAQLAWAGQPWTPAHRHRGQCHQHAGRGRRLRHSPIRRPSCWRNIFWGKWTATIYNCKVFTVFSVCLTVKIGHTLLFGVKYAHLSHVMESEEVCGL